MDDVLELTVAKPEAVRLVLAEGNVRPEVVEAADLVTEMRETKHLHQKGFEAQKGVDFWGRPPRSAASRRWALGARLPRLGRRLNLK